MGLPKELESIAERLLKSAMFNRDETLRAELDAREYEYKEKGIITKASYAQAQRASCIREMNDRLDLVWTTYRRVIVESGQPWNDEMKSGVLARFKIIFDNDLNFVQSMGSNSYAGHGHSVFLFLTDAAPAMKERINAEMDLFALRYRPAAAAVMHQLQAERYKGPRRHWVEAQAALRATPPQFSDGAREAVNAVEGMAKILAKKPKATLGKCIDELKRRGTLDSATANSLDVLWGLASGAPRLRHGSTADADTPRAQAEYIVGLSEAALRLLLSLDEPES